MTLLDACREVMRDPSMGAKYPEGLNAADVLTEIRAKHGADAFPLVSVIDVADEMQSFFGRPWADNRINRKGREMTTTNDLTPQQAADVIGSVVHSALIQSAGALQALRDANQALYDNDPEKAALVIRNYLTVWDTDEGVLVNLDNAIYSALPRGGEPVSGY